jgi:hypothetical protein
MQEMITYNFQGTVSTSTLSGVSSGNFIVGSLTYDKAHLVAVPPAGFFKANGARITVTVFLDSTQAVMTKRFSTPLGPTADITLQLGHVPGTQNDEFIASSDQVPVKLILDYPQGTLFSTNIEPSPITISNFSIHALEFGVNGPGPRFTATLDNIA